MFDYLQKLRAKPEHVREQIALGTAGTIALVIFFAWLVAFLDRGGLSFTPPGIAETPSLESAQTASVFSGFLGASAGSAQEEKSSGIEVVDANMPPAPEDAGEPSSIPF